jgi:hypothetical protein
LSGEEKFESTKAFVLGKKILFLEADIYNMGQSRASVDRQTNVSMIVISLSEM